MDLSEGERITLEGIMDLCAMGCEPQARRTMAWTGNDPEVDFGPLNSSIEYLFEISRFWAAEGAYTRILADDHRVELGVAERDEDGVLRYVLSYTVEVN